MTRHEAKDLFDEASDNSINYHDSTEVVSIASIEIIVNKIYDDFEKENKQIKKDLQTMKIIFDSEFCRCSKCENLKRSGFGCSCEND